jgi:hypothetical protein
MDSPMNKNPHRIHNYKKLETIPIWYHITTSTAKTITTPYLKITEEATLDSFNNQWNIYTMELEVLTNKHLYIINLLSDELGQWYVNWNNDSILGIESETVPISVNVVENIHTFSKWIGDELSKKLRQM